MLGVVHRMHPRIQGQCSLPGNALQMLQMPVPDDQEQHSRWAMETSQLPAGRKLHSSWAKGSSELLVSLPLLHHCSLCITIGFSGTSVYLSVKWETQSSILSRGKRDGVTRWAFLHPLLSIHCSFSPLPLLVLSLVLTLLVSPLSSFILCPLQVG